MPYRKIVAGPLERVSNHLDAPTSFKRPPAQEKIELII